MLPETMFSDFKKAVVNNWYRCTAGIQVIHVHEVHHPGGVDLCYDIYYPDGEPGTSDNPLESRDPKEYRQLEKLSDQEVAELKTKIASQKSAKSRTRPQRYLT